MTILLKIYKNFKIYHDARFVIEQSGFLGDQYVSVISVSNPPPVLTNGAEVECQEPFNLQEVARCAAGFVQRIDETAKKLDASVTDLRRVVLNANTLTNFAIAINNMRTVSEQAMGTVNDINAIIATNGAQVGLAVSNVAVLFAGLTRMADSADSLAGDERRRKSPPRCNNIKSSTDALKKMMDDLQAGQGLAGTLLQNPQLATNVQAIADNLSVASSNLNRLGLWAFSLAQGAAATPTRRRHPLRRLAIALTAMKPLWAIRILFLSLCIAGRLRHQPGRRNLSAIRTTAVRAWSSASVSAAC